MPDPTPFPDRLHAIVCGEAVRMRGNPERIADALAAVPGALAVLVAAAAQGDAAMASKLMEGATAAAFEGLEQALETVRTVQGIVSLAREASRER